MLNVSTRQCHSAHANRRVLRYCYRVCCSTDPHSTREWGERTEGIERARERPLIKLDWGAEWGNVLRVGYLVLICACTLFGSTGTTLTECGATQSQN